jgi:hypothetical protein
MNLEGSHLSSPPGGVALRNALEGVSQTGVPLGGQLGEGPLRGPMEGSLKRVSGGGPLEGVS